jgi:hypothetical protein
VVECRREVELSCPFGNRPDRGSVEQSPASGLVRSHGSGSTTHWLRSGGVVVSQVTDDG